MELAVIRLMLATVALLLMPVAAFSSDQSPDARYDKFLEVSGKIVDSGDYDRRQPRITSAYQDAVSGLGHNDTLSSHSDRDVHFLQLIAEAALYYGAGDDVADESARFFNEASRRSDVAIAARIYYRSMLLSGRWEVASSVEPLLAAIVPRIHVDVASSEGEGRAVLIANGVNRFKQTQRSPLAEGVYIIGHESCSWTRRALADLQNDVEAAAFVSGKAMLLSPANTVLQGAASEDSSFAVVLRASDWPEVRHWSLPSFVFVRDGQVVDNFSGWPGPETVDRFRSSMLKTTPSTASAHRYDAAP